MIFHSCQIIICMVFSLLAILATAKNATSTRCEQSCGEHSLPYPFGFSDECAIKLNCSGDSVKIGHFLVQNVTSDQILIGIPANCGRPVAELWSLFGKNFAPTSRNGLLFVDCKPPVDDCVVPKRLARSEVEFDQGCNSGPRNADSHNISCYFKGHDDHKKEFLNYTKLKNEGNCSFLLSSFMVDSNGSGGSGSRSSTILLALQMIELHWWIKGVCDCDSNATCVKTSYEGQQGFRCKCKEGYAGDGFSKGKGCSKVSHYSAPKHRPFQFIETAAGILIGGVIVGASMVTVLAAICVCIKRRSQSLKSRLSAKHLLSEAAGNSVIPFYPYKEIEKATNGFAERRMLGTGAYGTVYAGNLHNDKLVAIKRIRRRDHDSVEKVMNEINLLSFVSHPNLVRLLGCCIENSEQILVYEFMPNGTLSQHLQRERGSVLPWTIRLTIAAETARAIAYLHSAMNPPIYHRDIKSSNILLDYNFKSKVADFGLSRFGMTDDSHVSTAPQGTPGYVDPQYHQNFHLSDKSDVYSFGVVLLEIITALKVVDFSRPHTEINLAALAIDRIGKGHLDDIIDPFLEPNRDAWTLTSVHKVAELAFRSLAFHRDMRPSMMEVADELEQIRLSGWAPLEENVYMGSSVASSCSSPYVGSEKSFNTSTDKKVGARDSMLILPQRSADALPSAEQAMHSSPVSVRDPWSSEESSPSTKSLSVEVAR